MSESNRGLTYTLFFTAGVCMIQYASYQLLSLPALVATVKDSTAIVIPTTTLPADTGRKVIDLSTSPQKRILPVLIGVTIAASREEETPQTMAPVSQRIKSMRHRTAHQPSMPAVPHVPMPDLNEQETLRPTTTFCRKIGNPKAPTPKRTVCFERDDILRKIVRVTVNR